MTLRAHDRRKWRAGRRLGGPCARSACAGPLAARAGVAHRARARPPVAADAAPSFAPGSKRWLDAQVDTHLGRSEAWRGRDRPGEFAGRPGACGDAGGRRRPAAAQGHAQRHRPLDQADRHALHRLGSGSARSTSSCRRCSSPPRNVGARRCSRCARASRCRACPMPAPRRSAADADPRGAALAYRRLGRDLAPHRPCRPARQPCAQGPLGRRRRPGRRRARDLARPRRRSGRAADGRNRLRQSRRRWRWRGRRGPRPTAAARQPRLRRAGEAQAQSLADRPLPPLHPAGQKPDPRPSADRQRPCPHRRQARRKASDEVRVGSIIALPLRGRCACSKCSPARPPRPGREARACYEELGIDGGTAAT